MIGSIARKGEYVKDSLEQTDWMDYWDTAHDIHFDGKLTDEICERIIKAYNRHAVKTHRHVVSLRTLQLPVAKRVDVENRQLIVENSTMLAP